MTSPKSQAKTMLAATDRRQPNRRSPSNQSRPQSFPCVCQSCWNPRHQNDSVIIEANLKRALLSIRIYLRTQSINKPLFVIQTHTGRVTNTPAVEVNVHVPWIFFMCGCWLVGCVLVFWLLTMVEISGFTALSRLLLYSTVLVPCLLTRKLLLHLIDRLCTAESWVW